jgi:tetratricopeptide (TPR) repeat protein
MPFCDLSLAGRLERAEGKALLRVLVLVFITALPAALAQTSVTGHVMEMQDEIPPEKLPPPLRMNGIGNAHMEIMATPEAQMWFDQGLNLLHDFWDYESARAFEQAVRVDPQCAMCYWGLYKAESFYHSTAQGLAGRALAQAAALKEHASERERLYIDAAVAHDQALHNANSPNFSRELELLRKLVDDNPQDLQGRILLSNAGGQDSLAQLESVLKEDPENSAANHYYIHALEGGDHPEKALHSADILGRLAPASGHMVHMPGHIYFRIGDYARAERAFAASLAVDERYLREQHVEVDNDWNYVHNLMYFVADLLEEGKFHEATSLSSKIAGARGKLETTLYTNSARDSISRLDPRLPVALRTADFPQILKLVNASSVRPGLGNLEFLRRRLADFASGMEAVSRGNLQEAGRQSERLDAELWRMSQHQKDSAPMPGMAAPKPAADGPPKLAVMPDALLDPLLRTLSIMSLELRSTLSAAQGKTEDAKDLFAAAAREEKALGYREPPNYIRPVGETEGAAMLASRRWADAKAAFERALVERPHSGFALYGIALASERSGEREAAIKNYVDFLAAWKEADPALPQIAYARAYVAAHHE